MPKEQTYEEHIQELEESYLKAQQEQARVDLESSYGLAQCKYIADKLALDLPLSKSESVKLRLGIMRELRNAYRKAQLDAISTLEKALDGIKDARS